MRSAQALGIECVAVCSDPDATAPYVAEADIFARPCAAAGLIFVGPPPDVIEAMGSKLAAKATMAGAGVPVLPTVRIPAGTGEGHAVEGDLDEGHRPEGPIERRLAEGGLVEAAA